MRENRLYQADWLMRFYGFTAAEIAGDAHPDLDLEIDPKLAWALRHPEIFPVDVNRAEYGLILRVPGIGVKSARMIVTARRSGRITADAMARMGVVMKKARYFVTCGGVPAGACIADMTRNGYVGHSSPDRGAGRLPGSCRSPFPNDVTEGRTAATRDGYGIWLNI